MAFSDVEEAAVWTVREMVVWVEDGAGARYDPAADRWSALPTEGAPSARIGPAPVWTGREMVLWGGVNNFTLPNDGGRYLPPEAPRPPGK
jgi:hypothetical protein